VAVTFGVFTQETYDSLLGETQTVQVVQPTLYVNSYTGSNANVGTSPDTALGTIAQALSMAQNGSVIAIFGVFKEHCTTRLGLQDVTIVGLANTPRQATTSGVANGGGATWLSASGGTTALLTVQGQGFTVSNIYFNNSATAAPCIDLVTVGDPPAEADAAHILIEDCIFTGADNGIDATDGTNFVRIVNCTFLNFAGAGDIAINATGGVGTLLDWRIIGCKFYNNVSNIIAALSHGTISGCYFEAGSTTTIDLTNGTAPNFVVGNAFGIAAADFDPAGGVTGVTGDVWSNTLTNAIETGLPAN
jgi:hypothetical protein